MNLSKFFVLILINKVRAFELDGYNYKIVKGKKAVLNVTETMASRSAIECAKKCDSSNECTHANFRNKTCQFLKYDVSEMGINFKEEPSTKYICKYTILLYLK